MRILTTLQMEEIVDAGDTLVVNVLDRNAFERGHIPGSENVPLSDDDFVDRIEARTGDRNETVIVYCAGPDCDASERAAEILDEAGFTAVYDYEGGLKSWADAGHDVERPAPAARF